MLLSKALPRVSDTLGLKNTRQQQNSPFEVMAKVAKKGKLTHDTKPLLPHMVFTSAAASMPFDACFPATSMRACDVSEMLFFARDQQHRQLQSCLCTGVFLGKV